MKSTIQADGIVCCGNAFLDPGYHGWGDGYGFKACKDEVPAYCVESLPEIYLQGISCRAFVEMVVVHEV